MTGILNYATAATPTTLSTGLSSATPGATGSVVVVSNSGWPTRFPFSIIVDWDTANAEVITVTQAATGAGPFTYANCVRGDDGSNAPSHLAGASVTHGVSGRDFLKGSSAWINVTSADYGADPTGVNDSTAAFVAASNAVPAAGGVVYVPTGSYRINTGGTIVNNVTPTYYVGDGWNATQINFYGTGDCFRMFNPISGGGQLFGGGFHKMTIDGTNAGAGSAGIHAGDSGHLSFDVQVQNFNGTSSYGVHFDNTIWWTEKLKGIIYAYQNTQNVVFDVTGAGAGASFAYGNLDIWLNCLANQDGVVFQNGAYYYHERLAIRGNFAGGTTNTGAVLRVTGRLSGAGAYSRIRHSELTIGVEANGGAVQHQTIAVGTPGSNIIVGCNGNMDFGGGNSTFQSSNLSPSTTGLSFTYMGPVYGDTSLNPVLGSPATGGPTASYFGAMILPQASMSGSTGAVMTASGDMFQATLSASITINLNPSTGNQNSITLAGPQRKTIVIKQAAAGGPYTVTWPSNASPTTSSPTVIWPGGVTPAMSSAANAVDTYLLETLDGVTWYGQAYQAAPPDQSWYSGFISPAPAIYETYPRDLANSVRGAGSSGQLYVRAIGLPAGQVIKNLTLVTGATAQGGGSHGWYALLDSGLTVRAVSADQTGAITWTANTAVTLPVTSGGTYTTTYSGIYYVGVCVVAGTMPVFNGTGAMTTALNPLLSATSSNGLSTPPSLGSTMASLSNSTIANFYAYTS